MDYQQKYDVITRSLQEVVGKDDLLTMLQKEVQPIIYWGTAPTGRIHVGYFVQLLKISDYLNAGCKVKILIADIHAFLDNMKTSMKLLEHRSNYYTIMIKEMLKVLNTDISLLEFVKGSDFQLTKEYTLDMYKLNSLTSYSETKKAGAEVVKKSDNPYMTGLLYPVLQALDEQYLGAYIQTGGVDQRKIMMFAREALPKIGYRKRIHLMTPILGGLRQELEKEPLLKETVLTKEDKLEKLKLDPNMNLSIEFVDTLFDKYVEKEEAFANKMSASNNDSKLDILDQPFDIKKKINKAYCLPGDIKDNCLLDILEKVIFPIMVCHHKKFIIKRKEKFGGYLTYDTFDQVKTDFANEKLHPGDLKLGMIGTINDILEPIRQIFSTKDMKVLLKKAYN